MVTRDSIVVTCGDLEVIRWHGDSRRFSMMNEYSSANLTGDDHAHLWLGSWQTGFLFRDLELKPLTDSEAEQLSKSFSGVFPITPQSDVPLKRLTAPPTNPAVPPSSDQSEKRWLLKRKPDARALLVMTEDPGEWRRSTRSRYRDWRLTLLRHRQSTDY